MSEVQVAEVTFSYPPYKVPKFHANSPTPPPTTVRHVLRTLIPGARRKCSRRGTLFAYWYYIAARTNTGTVIATTSSGGRLGVVRRLSVRKELPVIAFGHLSGIRGPRVAGTTDRRVRIVR